MKPAIFWFRRDLRLEDNKGLFEALSKYDEVIPIYIFEDDKASPDNSRKNTLILNSLLKVNFKIQEQGGSGLIVQRGNPSTIISNLISLYDADAVFCNQEYEPACIQRDLQVSQNLELTNRTLNSYHDHLIFNKEDFENTASIHLAKFSKFKPKWLELFKSKNLESHPSENLLENFTKRIIPPFPGFEDLQFKKSPTPLLPEGLDLLKVKNYDQFRDYPALEATSKQSFNIRFGLQSIRKIVAQSKDLNSQFLNALIWREFYAFTLHSFPYTRNVEYIQKYQDINWRTDKEDFQKWATGQTGFPLVDAGMRELNQTGFMHTRLRIITANFLVKHLMIDWRMGENYFSEKLIDYDMSSNVGNWQWIAGTGCEAAPYFKVYNTYDETEKIDEDMEYIQKWVPEFASWNYTKPMEEHCVSLNQLDFAKIA
ncbi:MAG: DNA photolyase family protein [Lentisphaeraceae bacterium]|nr:DNA photolyase family protein [Lentisphaeraceae bacterium]